MFEFSSIEQYHALLTHGHTTCSEAVNYYLHSIKEQAHLNAYIEVYSEEALKIAEALDQKRIQGKPMGKLHGVVIGIKDVICYKDHRVTAASRILENFVSVYSSTVVERLLAEEAIIIGSLNCDEFAMGSTNENSVYGKVINPIDPTRVPGGSSGGSAAAMAAGLCMISLGSDTGGSVRQPADFCGVIGLKPGYGRISRYGLIAYASSFDQVGIFSQTIEDLALVLSVIAGKDEYDSTASELPVPFYPGKLETNQKFRFAYFKEALEHPGLDPHIATAILNLIQLLKENGHQVTEAPFEWMDHIVPAYYILTTAEASSNLSRYDGIKFGHRTEMKDRELNDMYKATRTEGFSREVRRRILLGTFVLSAGYYDAYFNRALKVRKLVSDRVSEIFNMFDFILLPTSPKTAFKFGEMSDPVTMYLSDIYTVLANLTGSPAISLPLFRHPDGLPFGLHVMSNRFDEVSLLQVSKALVRDFRVETA